jgi:tetratricopeptide (TPR) repeat protein
VPEAAPNRPDPRPPQHTPVLALLLGALALCAYAPIVAGDYQFLNADDDEYVTANPHVKGGLNGPDLRWALTALHANNWHPLTWVSLQLDAQLFGGHNAGAFHRTNVLLHAANTVVLFLVLRALTGAVWRSAVVAAFFAVHPLHVESVAWVAERKDVLSTLFWLLTVAAYAGYAARPGIDRYLLVVTTFAIGLMAKPMLVTLPCVLLLLDYWPLRRWRPGRWSAAGDPGAPSFAPASPGRLLLEKLPLAALAIGCCVLTLHAQQGIMQPLDYLPFPYRLGNALLSCTAYLGKMLVPMGLAIYYPHPGTAVSAWQAVVAGVLLLALTGLVLAAATRRPYLAVGWLWYLGTLVPVIGLVQVGLQARADRYTYIPLLGIFIALTWAARDLVAGRRGAPLAAAAAGTLLVAVCTALTWLQLPSWRSSRTLWERDLAVTAESAIAHEGLAKALEQEGQFEEARREYAAAIALGPDARRHTDYGIFLGQHGRSDEALAAFDAALALSSENQLAHYSAGLVRLRQGKLDEAQRHFLDVIRLNPGYGGGHYQLGVVLARQGKPGEAEEQFAEALRSNPRHANTLWQLGLAQESAGHLEEARASFEAALRSEPGHAEAHHALGRLLLRQGRLAEAQRHLTEAVRLNPRSAEARADLATVRQRQGQPDEPAAP